MNLPVQPIPAHDFRMVSGKRSPPDDGKEYHVQFRNGYVPQYRFTARQLVWKHEGHDWDVIAVNTDRRA